MWDLIILLILGFLLNFTNAAISITKITARVPNENDIGLIFDLCMVNTATEDKELLEFIIRSDGECCLNLTEDGQMMTGAGRIVGGNFGYIEPGSSETVSLIWPTVSLFNRVGSCPIVITAINSKSEQCNTKHILHFDTRFETLDPEERTLRKRKEYKDCENWDKEYLKNCTPVDCEERYFGRRSYYNVTSEQCEEVARCTESTEIYDIYSNECIDTKNFCNEEDIENIKKGLFEENNLSLKPDSPTVPHVVINEPCEAKYHPLTSEDLELKHAIARQIDEVDTDSSDSTLPYWLKGLSDGLLIVFATIAIYVLICFIIFLIVSWLSRRQSSGMKGKKCVVHTPCVSEGHLPLITHSSLMSQR